MIRILGAMTGTSCDGLDAACIEFDGRSWNTLWECSVPYPDRLRARVLAFQRPGTLGSIRTFLDLNRDLGIWYADAFSKMIQKHGKRPNLKPHAVANHGQTVAHFPSEAGKRPLGVTLQLGDPAWIAQKTGLTVISHFRNGDLTAGGQGAPLVPLFHRALAESLNGQKSSGIAIHNIGGISNLSYIGPRGDLLAFDTGPGNLWIDAAAERFTRGKLKFDRGGAIALGSAPLESSLKRLLSHPYFRLAPPKSTGRDDFAIEDFLNATRGDRPQSLVPTATEVTVRSIVDAYERWIIGKKLPLRQVFVCGGGAKNNALLKGIQKGLMPHGISVQALRTEDLDPQFIEAQAFAYFGLLSLLGEPIGGPWTGAHGFAPAGFITPGKNWLSVARLLPKIKSRRN